MVMDDLLRYRDEFPILQRTTYMISNSLGEMTREIGDEIGAIMNAPSASVSILLNVTSCQAVVASCFDFGGPRNKIVYSDMNFPSIMYFWEAQRSRGARVHMVRTDDGVHVPTERLLEAIDEETLLVPISHVVFRSSFIKDVKAITEKAHRVGAHVVMDCFQSLGNVPVDVQALNVDFAVGGVLKWLCGGPGTSYLYVRPDRAKKLEPKLTGWFAHENPFAFEIGENKYGEPPFRFMQGTSNVPGFYTAMPGLKIIREAGIERIREKSKRMTARLIELADQRRWRVNAPRDPEQRGGTVAIDMPNAKEVCAELCRRDVLVDYRPKAGVRFSPHFYNTLEEIDQAIATVDEILSEMGVAVVGR